MIRSLSRTSFLAGAAALAATRGARAADVAIRTGTIPADVAAVVTYARDLGYFKNAGLDVQLEVMQSGPVIAPAVVGGSLDVGAVNSGSLAGARLRGLPLRYFAPAAQVSVATATDAIMVKADSPIRNAADMNGKTVGIVAMKTLQHASVLAWADKHGGDSKTQKYVEVPFPEMIGALDAGRIDVAIPSEPFTSQARATHRVLGNPYEVFASPVLIFGYFATDAWLAANADVAQRFAGAIKQAAVWANGHPLASSTLLTRFTKMDPSLASAMGRATYATTLDVSMIQPAVDLMVRYGFLPKPIDANELIWRGK